MKNRSPIAALVASMALACGSNVPFSPLLAPPDGPDAAPSPAPAPVPTVAGTQDGGPVAPPITPSYALLVGGTVPVGPGVQVGYALTATSPMTYQLRWTGDARVAHDGYQQFTGAIWTNGHFSSIVPGCVDQVCPLEAGDTVSGVEQVAGGEQIEWNTFAADGWDGFGFVTDTEPVYFDVIIDGDRHPELFFFAASPGGDTTNPAASPFGMSSAP